MKALVYVESRKLVMKDLVRPTPKDDEVLVRVQAAGICGSDLHGFLGKSAIRYPEMVFGHEFTGSIEATGERISTTWIGQRVVPMPLVYCGACSECQRGKVNLCIDRKLIGAGLGEVLQGAFAEYVTVPARNIFVLPEELDYVRGVWTEALATPLHVVNRTAEERRVGGTVLILGAGCQGMLFLQLARRIGYADVVVVDTNVARLSAAEQLGATLVLTQLNPDSESRISEITSGNGFDLVVDTVGKTGLRAQAAESLKRGGLLLMIGLSEPELVLNEGKFVSNELKAQGFWCYSIADFRAAIELLRRGVVETESITRTVALDDGQEVFEELADGATTSAVKTIFVMAT